MIRSKTLIGLKRLAGLESLLYAVIGASGDPGTQAVGDFGVRRLVGAGEDLALGQQDRAGASRIPPLSSLVFASCFALML